MLNHSFVPTQKSKSFPQLDGVFVLNKPVGSTSNHCLHLFKKLGQKKIGHAGTLDPLASGVLLILLGQATKLSSHLLAGGKKTYSGRIRLGVVTDTWDSDGKILEERPFEHIERERVEQEISRWTDLSEQLVPGYSAAKHNGQPMYKLARRGVETPEKTKKIQIFEAGMSALEMPFVDFRVTCGSGVYVRSLAHSLGIRLGCGAALSSLTREYSHPFGLEQACSLEELAENPNLLEARLHSLADALPEWPRIAISCRQAADARNGKPLPAREVSSCGPARNAILHYANSPLALARLAMAANEPVWIIMRGLWN